MVSIESGMEITITLINYEKDGYELKQFQSTLSQGWTVRLKSREYYFNSAVSWPKITSESSARFLILMDLFDVAGCCYFPKEAEKKKAIVGFLNSKVARLFFRHSITYFKLRN